MNDKATHIDPTQGFDSPGESIGAPSPADYAASEEIGVIRQHKDTLFRNLFGSERRKASALSLYNALNGTSYENEADIEITTLDNALYLGMKNDISFLINDEMVLWEHQSTYNPNMPLRGLFYYAQIYARYVVKREVSLYSKRLIPLPTPRFVVFYIGREKQAFPTELRLSDAFKGDDPGLEVKASVIDINLESGSPILDVCSDLAGYSTLISKIREYEVGLSLEMAVDAAVKWCIDNGILEKYLSENRLEVRGMLLAEYDEARERELVRREGIQEGIEEGIEKGIEQGIEKGIEEGIEKGIEKGVEKEKGRWLAIIAGLVRDGSLDLEDAAKQFACSAEEIEKALKAPQGA